MCTYVRVLVATLFCLAGVHVRQPRSNRTLCFLILAAVCRSLWRERHCLQRAIAVALDPTLLLITHPASLLLSSGLHCNCSMRVSLVLLAALLAASCKCILSRGRPDGGGDGVSANGLPTCRARVAALRFNESRPPHFKSSWSPLIACESFSSFTCCSRDDSESIKRLNLMGASADHSTRCREFTERFNCMPCDGDVGTGAKAAACTSFCDEWFDACRHEFYKVSADGSTIKPCFGDYFICSKLRNIVAGGAGLCGIMGVAASDDEAHCYDGSPYPPGKQHGVPEPRPPSDDVELGGFQFRKGGGAVADLVRAAKKAWDKSTREELALAAACAVTTLLLGVKLTCGTLHRRCCLPADRGNDDSSSSSDSE
jgi:hypothetical protein